MKTVSPIKPLSETHSWCIPGRKCWVETPLPEIFLQANIKSLDEASHKVEVSFPSPPANSNLSPFYEQSQVHEFNDQRVPDTDYEDMVSMDCLNEPELLHNLKIRYLRDEIFTYIGPTLLILNPYKSLTDRFQEENISIYQKQTKSEVFNLKETPPHVYAISAKAYFQLFQNMRNQAIVISGESGAGKTENTKYAMRFLTSLSSEGSKPKPLEEAKHEDFNNSPIEDRILSCNPLLESFGNAKTVRNDNSSRFGKYVRILVDLKTKKIQGAAISNYLLEKSRVTTQAAGERNYHIFYQLFHCEDKALMNSIKLFGKSLESFEYLKTTANVSAKGVDDLQFYKEVWLSFEKMRFSEQEKATIYKILAGILYLGNLRFDEKNLTDKDPCEIANSDCLSDICEILDFNEKDLQKALVFKTREIGKQLIESPINIDECGFLRDSLSKGLYERLFIWLVKRLNLAILPSDDFAKTRSVRKSIKEMRKSVVMKEVNIRLAVGLLDIFGFENFQVNSFEQLCINFTNEKLQQLYIAYVFKSEEAEFIEQGLKDQLYRLSYEDNQPIIDLIDKYPMGIFDLLEESCSLGSGTEDALLQKMAKTYKENIKFALKKLNKEIFLLTHTAKAVEYTITGFRNKNKDFLPKEMENVILRGSNETISAIYENKDTESNGDNVKKGKAGKTLAGKFRGQMKDLMQELMSCDVNFIRCIKPNETKQADFFLASFVLTQIKYLGVLESIRIRKEGFPYRKEYANFCESHFDLLKKKKEIRDEKDPKLRAGKMLDELFENGRSCALFGSSKIYLKQDLAIELDKKLMALYKRKSRSALKVLKQYRRYRSRKGLLLKLEALHKKLKGFCKIQAFFKRKQMRRRFLAKKQTITRMNRYFRRRSMKNYLKNWLEKVLMFRKWTKKKQSAVKIFGFAKRVLRGFFMRKWLKATKEKSEFMLKEKLLKEKELMLLQEKERKDKEILEEKARKERENQEFEEKNRLEKEMQEETAKREKELKKEAEKARREAEKALQKAALARMPSKKHQDFDPHKSSEESAMGGEPLSINILSSIEKSNEKPLEKPNEKPLEKPINIENPIEKPIEKSFEKAETSFDKPIGNLIEEESKSSFDKPKIIEILTKSRGVINLSSLKPLSQDLLLLLKYGLPLPKSLLPPETLTLPIQQPFSQDQNLDINSLDSKLLQSLTQYSFWQFAEPLVSHQKSWGKSVSVASILSFAKSDVNIPLLPHSDSKDKDTSIRVFNILKKFLLTKNEENELLTTMKILMEGFYGTTGLRDEIYLQVLKQLNNNPDKFLRLKLYKLLGVLGSTFPVSLRTLCVMLSFLLEICQGLTKLEIEPELINHARFSFNRILKSFETGGKSLPPLEHELKALWHLKTIPIKLSFLNNKPLTIYIESWSTVEMTLILIEKVLEFQGMRHYLGLAVRENQLEDQFLPEDAILIEELTRLEFRRMKDLSKEYRLVVKLRLFYPNLTSTPEAIDIVNLTYFQCLDEFLKGTFQNIQLDDIVLLASLHLYIEKGGSSYEKIFNVENSGDNLEIGVDIEKYTPKGCITKDVTKQYILVKVLNRYLNDKDKKSSEASKLEFCNYLKRFDEFMGTQFIARYLRVSLVKGGTINESSIEEVLVYFKPFLILLVSKGTKNKNVFHYKEIEAFGTLDNPKGIFAFRTFDLEIHLLECAKEKEMEGVMEGYIRLLRGVNQKKMSDF